jgi:hypothetical protein
MTHQENGRYSEVHHKETAPGWPKSYRAIGREDFPEGFGGPLFTDEQIRDAEEKGNTPVSLSGYGISIEAGDEHFNQVSLLWETFGVKLSVNPETNEVVFPSNQIRNLDRAYTDTQFIIYDHIKGGREGIDMLGKHINEVIKTDGNRAA